jgi:O-antigen/teichoic acid export membrane protein
VRGALALLSAQPLTWTASVLTAVFVPRFLGDEGLGQYAVAQGLTALVATVVVLGTPDLLVRRIASRPARAAADGSGALVFLLGLSGLVAVGLWLALPRLGLMLPDAVLQFVPAGVVVSVVQLLLFGVLRGRERHARFAWLNASGVMAGAAAGLAVLAAGGGIVAYMAVILITSTAVAVLAWYASELRVGRTAFDPRLWGQLVRGGLPFLGWSVAVQSRGQMDVILLGLLLREHVVGWLAAAQRIVWIPVFIPTLVTTPLLPALSRSADDRAVFEQTLRRSVVLVLVLSVPACATVIALASAIPDLLGWPRAFHQSVPLMVILACAQPIIAVDMVLGTALMALHQERRWLCVGVLGALFGLAMNVAMIPIFERWLQNGAIGAAAATLTTELVMLGGALALTPRGVLDGHTAGLSARVVAAGAGLVAAVLALRAALQPLPLPLGVALAAAGGGGAYVVGLVALGVVRADDIQKVMEAVRRLAPRRRAWAAEVA